MLRLISMLSHQLPQHNETPAGNCHQLILELLRTYYILNAPTEILDIVAAVSNTMSDEEIVTVVREWNNRNETTGPVNPEFLRTLWKELKLPGKSS